MSKPNNTFTGHRALEKGKYAELRKFINHWLTDQSIYCNNCGMPYFPKEKPCCEKPEIGKNFDHCWAVVIQNKARQKQSSNEYASNSTMTMRLGLSMPSQLLRSLEQFSLKRFQEKLFVNQKDFRRFCKAFPQFTIMERI